jgi:DNA polymerase-3 subunit alpha
MRFVHLHTHSHYSLLDGLSKIDNLVDKARSLKMDSIALTDHGVLYGAIEFYKKALAAGIKPILGVEAYLTPGNHTDRTSASDEKRYYHLILLAKNKEGWQSLIKLTTTAHLDGYYYKPRVDKALLRQYAGNIVCLSACLGGELAQLVKNGKRDEARTAAREYQEIFGKENFFIELGRHPNIPDCMRVDKELIALARELSIPVVATADSHYLNTEDAEAHDILLCVQTGSKMTDPNRMSLRSDDYSLASAETMIERFKDIPEAIENTGRIADMCDLKIDLNQIHLPNFSVPEGSTPNSFLRALAQKGLAKKYSTVTPEIQERFDYEVSVIEKTGFADYFLIVQDFVNWAKDHGIVVGPGRGSAAGSIVSYALNITEVDPLKYGLLFERFLNPDRIQMPDIDIDITDLRRDEVLSYIKSKYGEDRVAQIITFGTMAARAAIRDAARSLGFPYGFGDQIAKLIPFNNDLDEALANVSELADLNRNNPDAKRILDIAKKLEGVVRHASVHACGIVIAGYPLVKFIPLQRAPQDDTNIITQFEMHSIEDLGLLKIDLLGLRNLTIIEEALRIIQEHTGSKLNFHEIPLDDAKAFEIFRKAETIGIFQLESEGMRHYIKELKPTDLEDIIVMISLYRPGPMDLIPSYIARKHGREKVTYIHPKLEPILGITYGVGVYQEQMMRIARDLAGFSLAQADTLRKAIGKKIEKLLNEQKEKLISGMIANGIEKRTAEEIWELFPPFARYGFNKSHSAAYAIIGYQTAYLKANYPLEFMTSLFRAEGHDSERATLLIAEARRMGIATLTPDINRSSAAFSIDTESLTPAIRFGLAAIKNVGEHIVEAITGERAHGGPFSDLENLLLRVQHKDLNKKSLESLTMGGALDCFGIDRGVILANMDAILSFAAEHRKSASSSQGGLFDDIGYKSAHLKLKDAPVADRMAKLTWEKELLGFYLSEHPLDIHAEKIEAEKAVTVSGLAGKPSRELKVAGVVSSVKKIIAKNGKAMAFARLEDKTANVELVVFGDVYEKNPAMWTTNAVVLVSAKPQTRDGELKLIANDAVLL